MYLPIDSVLRVMEVTNGHIGDIQRTMKGMNNEYTGENDEGIDHLLSLHYAL